MGGARAGRSAELAGWLPAAALLALAVAVASVVVLRAWPAQTSVPIVVQGSNPHLGVASCAGSTCHGRQEPTGAVVRQDELRIWQDDSSPAGAHSRAWRVLGEARGRAIADKLGIGDPQRAPMCLGCHSDALGGGAGFHAADGVGCEACHGGAQGWLTSHYAMGASHAADVANGMIPLDQPKARAAVCLDCHFGGDRPGQFVDHRIMAAGHPRLSFELDLFSTLEKHWNEDADYARRKRAPSAATLWAVGQAAAVARQLALYADPLKGQDGVFPQFTFFDCQGCHRRISDDPAWRPQAIANPGRPVPVGTPPFQDENMLMLGAAARAAAPALAERLEADSRAFHIALTQGREPAIGAATRLRATATALADRFSADPPGTGETFAMIAALSDRVTAPRYTDYEGSVQAVMAIDTLLSGLTDAGAVPRAAAAGIRPDIDRAYAAVRDPDAYRPLAFREAIGRATAAIGARR